MRLEKSDRQVYGEKIRYAKLLRRRMTSAEGVLWEAIRNRRCSGMKFRRQVPMRKYITDFLCREHRLVIEVDGKIHEQQREYDAFRDQQLAAHGYRMLRVTNEDVLLRLPYVLAQIAAYAIPPLPEGT